jgi:DNA-binding transcriptional LysR family regulator
MLVGKDEDEIRSLHEMERLTVLPRFSSRLPGKHRAVAALPVELPDTRRPIGIITLKNRMLGPLAQLFLDRVRGITRPLSSAI